MATPSEKQLSILILDDEVDMAVSIKRALESKLSGCQITMANSSFSDGMAKGYDLLIVRATNFKAEPAIRAAVDAGVPVLMISGTWHDDGKKRMVENLGGKFLALPFTLDALLYLAAPLLGFEAKWVRK